MNYSKKAWEAARARFKQMKDESRVLEHLLSQAKLAQEFQQDNTAKFWLECG